MQAPASSSSQTQNAVDAVLIPPASPGKNPEERRKRVEIAEANYSLRKNWSVPQTMLITYQDCEDSRARVVGFGKEPDVTFSQWSTADALLHFVRAKNAQVCALNFANGSRVGGGYKTGAIAQEEDLCRRIPNLYTTLYNAKLSGHYPFGPSTCSSADRPERYSDVLFTPGLVVARKSEQDGYDLLPDEQQANNVALVTAACPNIPEKEILDLALMYNTVKAIFVAPRLLQQETSVLILGAWGCGAFGGDAKQVSELFAQALTKDGLGQLYQEVHFAIPCFDPSDKNGEIFRQTFVDQRINFTEIPADRV